jgi:hypothetical protein
MVQFAAALAFFIGLAHSVLGERYILVRLFRREDLPKIFGSDSFTRGTLRFGWHLTTVAWWGFAAILICATCNVTNLRSNILYIISIVFFLSGLMSGGFTRGRHLSWIVFFAISGLSAYAATFGS